MNTEVHSHTVWEGIPDIFTVVGFKGIAALTKRECVVDTVDEGESVLLTIELGNQRKKLRILKAHPDLAIVIPDYRKFAPKVVLDAIEEDNNARQRPELNSENNTD